MTLPGRRRPGRSLKEGCNIGPGGHTQSPQPLRQRTGRSKDGKLRGVNPAARGINGYLSLRGIRPRLGDDEGAPSTWFWLRPQTHLSQPFCARWARTTQRSLRCSGRRPRPWPSTIRVWLTHPRRWRDGQRSRCRGEQTKTKSV